MRARMKINRTYFRWNATNPKHGMHSRIHRVTLQKTMSEPINMEELKVALHSCYGILEASTTLVATRLFVAPHRQDSITAGSLKNESACERCRQGFSAM